LLIPTSSAVASPYLIKISALRAINHFDSSLVSKKYDLFAPAAISTNVRLSMFAISRGSKKYNWIQIKEGLSFGIEQFGVIIGFLDGRISILCQHNYNLLQFARQCSVTVTVAEHDFIILCISLH